MNPLNRMNPGASKSMNNGGHIVSSGDVCMKDGCEKTNDGTGSGYCSYECYATVEGTYRSSEPYTGNGYGAEVSHVSGEPTTIPEYVESIVIRAGDLNRWIGRVAKFKTDGPIVRETIARMEGDLQQLRTLVKDIEKAESEPTAFENLCETMPELAERVRSIGKAGE